MRLLALASMCAAMLVASPALAKHDNGHGGDHGRHGHNGWHDDDDDDDHHGPRGNAYGYYRNHGDWRRARYFYNRGQRLSYGYNGWSDYRSLPYEYRHRYGFNPGYRYIYRENVVYVVDPTTRLVRDIVDLLRY